MILYHWYIPATFRDWRLRLPVELDYGIVQFRSHCAQLAVALYRYKTCNRNIQLENDLGLSRQMATKQVDGQILACQLDNSGFFNRQFLLPTMFSLSLSGWTIMPYPRFISRYCKAPTLARKHKETSITDDLIKSHVTSNNFGFRIPKQNQITHIYHCWERHVTLLPSYPARHTPSNGRLPSWLSTPPPFCFACRW